MKFRPALLAAIPAAAALLAGFPAHALTFNTTFNANVGAQAQAAFNFATAEFSAAYTDAVTVNLNVLFGNTGLGGSSTALQFVVPDTYAKVRADLIADQLAHPSADGATSIGAGGSVNTLIDPTNGGRFLYTFAQAKALGARAANAPGTDGTITFSNAQTFTFNPLSRGGPGFDFIGVAEHEISEVMGTIPGLGTSFCNPGCGPDYLVFDLFRYSAAATRKLVDASGVYFSIDNGTTNLHGFNFANGNGSDPQDWDSSDPTDPRNAFTGPNQAHAISAVDFTTLDVIGWDLKAAAPVPEPETYALMLAGLGVLGTIARRRRNARRD